MVAVKSQQKSSETELDAWLDYICHWVDGSPEEACRFSGYIKHPADIPLDYSIESTPSIVTAPAINTHRGGMVFQTDAALPVGVRINLRLMLNGAKLALHGAITHCILMPEGHWDVGVTFAEDNEHYAMRMIEQACHIEHYRKAVAQTGRELSSDEAAKEWIHKFAACFPS